MGSIVFNKLGLSMTGYAGAAFFLATVLVSVYSARSVGAQSTTVTSPEYKAGGSSDKGGQA